ncbi:unnamed protein product, partial [Ectocarpus sp. 12 AP-2014]
RTSQTGVLSVSVSSGRTSEENKRPPSTNYVCIRVSWKSASRTSTSYPECNLVGPYDGGRTVGQPGVVGIAVEYVTSETFCSPQVRWRLQGCALRVDGTTPRRSSSYCLNAVHALLMGSLVGLVCDWGRSYPVRRAW